MRRAPVTLQPVLFDLSESFAQVSDHLPEVWEALESLTVPDPARRHQSLDRLLEMDVLRVSPLVAYVLATRISDPEIDLRFRVVQAIGDILTPSDPTKTPTKAVQHTIKEHLSQLRNRPIFGLLQVAAQYPPAETNIATIFNHCSFAGSTLADIFTDRRHPVEIRRQAIFFVGRVGFLDAIPALERLIDRLAGRLNGQRKMPFAPPFLPDEESLISVAQSALALLKAS